MSVRVSDDRVYDAVLDTVAAAGYRGATTRRIAETAGINEVTLFRRWGDKRRLLGAAINAEISQLSTTPAQPTGDVAADLEQVVDYYARLYRHRGGLLIALLLEASLDPEVAALLHEPATVLSRLEAMLVAYQDAGVLRREPAREAVEALLGPLLMATITGRVGIRPGLAPPSATSVVRRFLDGRQLAAAS